MPKTERSSLLFGSVLALLPSFVNIAYAMRSKLTRSGGMALNDFVNLYVHLRHPHHYDPASWPPGIWAAVMWTIIPSVLVLRGQAIRIYLMLVFLIVIALLGAGLSYVSETLIQMSLYRFSIYLQLFGCAAAGVLVERSLSIRAPKNRAARDGSAPKKPTPGTAYGDLMPASEFRSPAMGFGWVLCIIVAAACIGRGPFFGLFKMPDDEQDYIALCEWISRNTPVDAVMMVPPDEESMRLIGRRAVIVNYKSVPQLSSELAEWRNRLCDVLDIRDLNELPRRYTRTFPALHNLYHQVSEEALEAAARKYGARYIVATHPLERIHAVRINADGTGRYILYDLNG